MTLPKLSQVTVDHVVTLDDDLTVTFQLSPIPGLRWNEILTEGRDESGTTPHEAIAVDVLAAGIGSVYSSVESSPAPFTVPDAREIWDEWPDWARWDIYRAVYAYATKGPAADPFVRSTPRKTGDE